MGFTRDDHSVEIDGSIVSVTGRTGPLQSRWALQVDGRTVDEATASGDFRLRGQLPDDTAVSADVHQSLMGPTRVTIFHGDDEVATLQGFVA